MPTTNYNLNKAIEHIKNLEIAESNKRYILDFNEYQAAEGLSKARQVKYLYILCKVARFMDKDFSKAGKQDIVKLCSKINNSNFAEWTKHDYMVIIKRFYKWLREKEGQELDNREYPKEVKWITPKKRNHRQQLPKQLLTIEDTKKLANHANNLRDRSLILVLYETGARIGELLDLKMKDIEFDKYGAKLTLFGKTGPRKIRIIASAPSISNWLLEHPRNIYKNPEEFKNKASETYLFCGLWGKNKGEQLQYRHVNKLLKDAGEKAGVNKPMNPHHFRHSRATELAKKFTEAQLCKYLGWVQGSKEAATYVHLSGKDLDSAILELHGLKEEEKEADKFRYLECPRCGIKNDPAARFCSGCSLGLDEKSMMEYDEQKELATKLGFHALNSPDMEDSIGNMLLKKIQDLEKNIEELKKKK